MKHSLYIFDFDGTLGDTTGIILDTMAETFRRKGMTGYTREQYKATIGLPLEKCFCSILNCSDEEAAEYASLYRHIFDTLDTKGAVTLYPRVMETLEALKEQGAHIAIASSRHCITLDRYIANLGLSSLVEMRVGADNVTKPKPDPQPVQLILDKLGFKPEETVVIGDAPFDILMGRAAGCITIAVTYGNGTGASLKAAGADYLVNDFSEILNLKRV